MERMKRTTALSAKSLFAFCCLLGVACVFAGNALGLSREAFRMMEERAERGDARAQKDVAAIYNGGLEGVTEDLRKAAKWFRRCAEQGDAVCQAQLGKMYGEGRGVAKDDEKAVYWIDKAAKAGHPEAQEAMRTLEKSDACADRCEAEAMTCLAMCETIPDDGSLRGYNCNYLCREAAKSCGRSCSAPKNDACLARGEAEAITCLANCETISAGYRRGECERSCREFAKSYRCR